MANLEFEIARATANGDVKSTSEGFSTKMRSLENQGLEAGDTWTFPEKFDIYTTTVGSTEGVEYIWIELTSGNAKKFFPSTFMKSRTLYELDEKQRPRVLLDKNKVPMRACTTGNATEEFRKHPTVNEAMQALAGKTVTVSKIDTKPTLNYNDSSKLQQTQFCEINFVK